MVNGQATIEELIIVLVNEINEAENDDNKNT